MIIIIHENNIKIKRITRNKTSVIMRVNTRVQMFYFLITIHIIYKKRTEQNRTENLFVKTCTYIHHHTKHLIQLYTRDIQL